MTYVSLYRKYRSQTFEELEGQEHVSRTLKNALEAGRMAHAYLFCGPRGTGKTSSARILAKCLNCDKGPTAHPCGVCSACIQIAEGRYLDVREIDAASNRGIDDIRELRENVMYAPAEGRYKVYVIDEAHQITHDAFNAFLKTLEEPPPHVVFVLATTDAHRIPATIVSRCQRFEFRPATRRQLRDRVQEVARLEGSSVSDAAADLIAREAEGGWRDALSILEQVLAFSQETITPREVHAVLGTLEAEHLEKLTDLLQEGQGGEVFGILDELFAEGKDARQLLRSLTGHFRSLMLQAVGSPPEVELEQAAVLKRQAAQWGAMRLVAAIKTLSQADREMRWSDQPRLQLELAMLPLLQPAAAEPSPARPAAAARRPAAPAAPADARPSTAPAAAPPEAEKPPRPLREETRPAAPPEPREAAAVQEPAPSAPASSRPAANGDPLDLVRARWHTALQELRRMRMVHLQSYLTDAAPDRIEGETLIIRMQHQTWVEGFRRRASEFAPRLAEAIAQVTGLQFTVRVEGPNDVPQHPTPDRAAPAKAPPAAVAVPSRDRGEEPDQLLTGEALLRDVLEVTGGRYLETDE